MTSKLTIGFLHGPNGERSSSRLTMVIVMGAVLLVWAWCSIKGSSLQDIPQGVLWIVGIASGAKVGNSIFAEQPAKPEVAQ